MYVCLFPRKQQCAVLNAGMFLVTGPEIILKATDATAALEYTVAIKIDCKVMLHFDFIFHFIS